MSDIYHIYKTIGKNCASNESPALLYPTDVICGWRQAGGLWFSDCGLEWGFIEDGPQENGMNYCPKCGKTLLSKGGDENAGN
ncbi:hypothetical protein VL2_gp038 [Pseudomonas phage vB_PaeM_VL12]|nr:hypothetical protein VL2_gp038 [Pseudomonas phage vB_PaeM_VL12]